MCSFFFEGRCKHGDQCTFLHPQIPMGGHVAQPRGRVADEHDPLQREYAFRSGVNIVMYVLTGNYKADQVHIPALLERLGQ